jgi:hypothetical protein
VFHHDLPNSELPIKEFRCKEYRMSQECRKKKKRLLQLTMLRIFGAAGRTFQHRESGWIFIDGGAVDSGMAAERPPVRQDFIAAVS